MSNTQAPVGFRQVGRLPGVTPNYELQWRLISSSYATAVFQGDAVKEVSGGTSKYIQQFAKTNGTVFGIAVAFNYISTALQRRVWTTYWPGSGATGDVNVGIITDPNAVFQVQTDATGIGPNHIGANVDIASSPAGNTANGQSGMYLDSSTLATTSTLPFRIYGMSNDPNNDPTSGYDWVLVTFNNQAWKNLTSVNS